MRSGTMPEFTLHLDLDAPPEEVWAKLWDLERHTQAIPLTAVRLVAGDRLTEDSRFIARTGLGPFGFDDRMAVRTFEPPRCAVIVKEGSLLFGTITATLTPVAGGCRLRWRQTYALTHVPNSLARPLLRRGYRRALRAITA
ncbi:MAG: SRPBCC family protein [Bowdeniella nasicola]|nr:SRPBCC family protein [Bowdeniella nasicola]